MTQRRLAVHVDAIVARADALRRQKKTQADWVQLPLTPQLAEPVHDEAALAEVAARVREAVG